MPRYLRALLVALLLISALLGALIFWANLQWQSLKQEWSVSALSWQGLAWDKQSKSWSLDHVYLQRTLPDGSEQQLDLQNVVLSSGELWPWPVHTLTITHSQLKLLPSESVDSAKSVSLPSTQLIEDIRRSLPANIAFQQITLDLPCKQTRCLERWGFNANTADTPSVTHWQLTRYDPEHQLHLSGTLQTHQATAQLQLDNHALAALTLHWQPRDEYQLIQGEMHLIQLPQQDWLLKQLARVWDSSTLPQEPWPKDVQLNTRWDIHWPYSLSTESSWNSVKGQIDVQALLHSPYRLPSIGTWSGALNAQLVNTDQAWRVQVSNSQLNWQPEVGALAHEFKQFIAPSYLITLSAVDNSDSERTSVHTQIRSQGSSGLHQQATAILSARWDTEPSLTIEQGQLHLRNQHVDWQNIHAQQFELSADFNASLNSAHGSWQWLPNTTLKVASLSDASLGIRAQGGTLTTQGSMNWDAQHGVSLGPHWPLKLRIQSLHHEAVRPQSWEWNGQLRLANNWRLQGSLSNAAQLQVETQLSHTAEQTLLKLKMPKASLLKANPISQTLAVWPSLLLMVQGSVSAEADLSWPANRPFSLRSNIELHNLGGIYDRIELQGLSAQFGAQLKDDWLAVSTPQLSLQQANVGLALTDLAIHQLSFSGPVQQLTKQGDVRWSGASFALLNGQVSTGAGLFALKHQGLAQPITVQGINLANLLEEYPASGLSGTGIIDGHLLLRHSPKGFRIDNGQLQARPEGGWLNFDSSKIYAAARTNPALQIVVSALENFHYQRLSSSIRYDEDGTLLLGMKLQGQNPELENGHPIHFSVNLEENIPALLTSLQLSDRVSETLQQRVKERLQRNNPTDL